MFGALAKSGVVHGFAQPLLCGFVLAVENDVERVKEKAEIFVP